MPDHGKGACFEHKARAALELGERYLRVENGHMTIIDPESDCWKAIASSSGDEYSAGTVMDLQRTFCRKTIERDDSLALHDVPEQGWEGDPAFEATGLHTYHGTALELGEGFYGTVCFVSSSPRAEPFEKSEMLFAELIARMLEYELTCEHYESELERRAELLDVVNRVLRHNLRNDLNYVHGIVRMLPAEGSRSDVESVIDTIEGLIELSETARQLDAVVRRDTEFAERSVASVVAGATKTASSEYPELSVDVEAVTDTAVLAKPTLEVALRELLENVARHAEPDPEATIGVEAVDDGVEIGVADNGDGLPAQERTVLATGNQTPLVHGSGLGLWMVYWIVTDHGGSVDVAVDEQGTTITLSVSHNPLARS